MLEIPQSSTSYLIKKTKLILAQVDKDAAIEDKGKDTKDPVAVETEGHVVLAEKEKNGESKTDGETSDRVREGQKWNNRNRTPKKFKENIKSDLTSQPVSSDPVEIRKQVEFYFSDSNLMSDIFLYSKVEGHQNLPVPLSIIHSFKRMRHFQPYSAVVDALKESKVLNVTENGTCVQRKVPLPEHLKDKPMVEIQQVYEDEAMARSVYVKGFGEEQPSTQFDIEAFFAEYGSTNSVRLRRANNKVFKGSVFVEFDSEVTQKAFLAQDPKPKWKGNDLAIKSKKQYCDEKVNDIRAGKVRPNQEDRRPSHRDKRGDNDDRDWRVRRDEDSKSGFKDRNGRGHKGFGSSGRGRGGGRGRGRDRDGRENRDRNGRDRNEEKKSSKDEKYVSLIPLTSMLLWRFSTKSQPAPHLNQSLQPPNTQPRRTRYQRQLKSPKGPSYQIALPSPPQNPPLRSVRVMAMTMEPESKEPLRRWISRTNCHDNALRFCGTLLLS